MNFLQEEGPMKTKLHAVLWFLTATLLGAEELPDTMQLRLGAYLLADQDTELRADTRKGVSGVVNLQELLDMETTQQVFRANGYYRFAPKHRIEAAWYSINNSSHKTLQSDFSWVDKEGNDINITAGTKLSSHFDTDIYKINYTYSFYRSDKVELGLGAGLHITRISIGFNGSVDVNGTTEPIDAKSIDTTAPLPVIGFRLHYKILPELSVDYATDFFFIAFENVEGGLTDSILTLDYRFSKHVGAGIGFNRTLMHLISDEGDYDLRVSHNVTGGLAYISFHY
jgi:hypothetical protein